MKDHRIRPDCSELNETINRSGLFYLSNDYLSILKIPLFILFFLLPCMIWAQCNGHGELCDRHYDEVAYVTTHNAFNAGEDGFNLPNQTYGLTRQLNDGVRALMLDVYDEGGVATVYHGFSWLGTTTLESNLMEIKEFLDANPNEVVTLLFETYISANLMDTVLTQVGLKSILHVQSLSDPWPTLQEMIDANKRLVLFSDHNNGQIGQDWYHYMWSFAVETDFDNNALSDFSCEFNRGSANNDLFILNHFATDPNLGTGRTDLASQANSYNYFYGRALDCKAETGKFPNFLTVDFYELGDVFSVADALNGITNSVGIDEKSNEANVSAFPNPSSNVFTISCADMTGGQLTVYNLTGATITGQTLERTTIQLNLENHPIGVYIVKLTSDHRTETLRLFKTY